MICTNTSSRSGWTSSISRMRDARRAQLGERRLDLGVLAELEGVPPGLPAAPPRAPRAVPGTAPSSRTRRYSAWNRRMRFSRRVERDDPAALQHRDAVTEHLRFLDVVGGEHDGVAVAVEPADELPQPLAQLDVDAGGRLVEHDHRRPVHQRLRDQHPALHAARERAHVGVGLRREVEVVHHLVDPVAVRRAARSSPTGSRASRAR